MRRLVGIVMMLDGALQATGVTAVMLTILDRSLRDQGLFVAHLVVGAGLMWSGRSLYGDGQAEVDRSTVLVRASASLLLLALVISLVEATWFDWIGCAIRAVYTLVALAVVLRKTTLPTT